MTDIQRLATELAASACVNLGKVVLGAFLVSAAFAYLVICAGRALEAAPREFNERS